MLWDFQNLRWSSMKMLLNNETNLISRMSVSRATSPINTISPNNLQQTSVAVVRNCYTRRPVSGSGFSNLPQSLPAPLPTPYYQTRARVENDSKFKLIASENNHKNMIFALELTLIWFLYIEMFYLNTIEQLLLFVEQLDQLKVCLPYNRLLAGIPIPKI